MRAHLLGMLLIAGAPFLAAGSANAGANVTVKTKYYDIRGETGETLIRAMDRKGPKHGFLARAIAQTQYSIRSGADFKFDGRACRASHPEIGLDITYVYPRVATPVSQQLEQRWTRFFAGVQKHEQTHGRIANEMARAAEQAINRVSVPGDRSCSQARMEMKRRVNAVIADYERRQVQFDAVEHQANGNVSHLVYGLLGARQKKS